MCVDCCSLVFVCCLLCLFVVGCSSSVAMRVSVVVCRLLFVVCCLQFVACRFFLFL